MKLKNPGEEITAQLDAMSHHDSESDIRDVALRALETLKRAD